MSEGEDEFFGHDVLVHVQNTTEIFGLEVSPLILTNDLLHLILPITSSITSKIPLGINN